MVFCVSVLIIKGLSARVFGVTLILFDVLYHLLYKGGGRKKLCRIAPDFTNLIVKTIVDIIGIGVGPLNFFFTQLYLEGVPCTGTKILCHWING